MANMGNIEEWDYIDVLPQYEDPRPRIAGNYGPASNIWHIGMVSSTCPIITSIGIPSRRTLTPWEVSARFDNPPPSALPPGCRGSSESPRLGERSWLLFHTGCALGHRCK